MSNKRVDKWLWAVRFFPTRTQASDACQAGKVKVNGEKVKPSRTISEGMTVEINKKEKIIVIVKGVIEKRVGAEIALQQYENITPINMVSNSELNSAFLGLPYRQKGTGRPTKKERREIDSWSQE